MPDSRQFDVRKLEDLVLPYDKVTKQLSDAPPRLVDGLNVYPTLGGKISLRPGLNNTGLTGYYITGWRADRLVIYETLENPPKVYLLASCYAAPPTDCWAMFYIRLDAASPAWTPFPDLRNLNSSTRAHEIVVARGLAFVKAFPAGTGNKYGSVIFDGSGSGTPFTAFWGVAGPANPIVLYASTGWSASTNPVTVRVGWKYAYAYKTRTGHYSNRGPRIGSTGTVNDDTGAFTNKKPKMAYVEHSDTTNVPYIGMFRSTDGGGTWYHLEDVANTGAGSKDYEDNHRNPATTDDPKLDIQLDSVNIAPSLLSNTVPPPCSAGKVIGTDPVEPSTPLAYYARRVWYGIGNRLYFSGQEEIINGVPEESFPNPNGIIGSFYLFKGQVRHVKAAKSALYVGTSDEILAIKGENLANFRAVQIAAEVCAVSGHPRACASFRDGYFFLGQDLQVYGILGEMPPVILSRPLGDDLRSKITSSTEVAMEVFSRDGTAWLLVAVIDKTTPANTRVYVYDLERQIWFPPWAMPVSAMAFGRLRETDQNKHLVVLSWSGTTSYISVLDFNVNGDLGTPVAPSFTTNLFTVPTGNHINTLRQPAQVPQIAYLIVERTKFSGDTDPTIKYRLDEFSGTLTTASQVDPPYMAQRTSWQQKWCPIEQAAQRVQLDVSKSAEDKKFEIQNVAFVFQPEAGV